MRKGFFMSVEAAQKIIDDFSLFDDWEDRYRYLIDLGRKIPHLDEDLKIDTYIVRGCSSRVWLIPSVEGGVFTFRADSDAHIVRGLVALLMKIYQGCPIDQIKNIDINAAFKEIGLDQHLSANRRSGFFAMVEKIRAISP